ncbi:SPOCS domain-containing protein [Oceanirhabdus sp. W0125-5]|uniref:SPOCS domain-containing protein n=1 Tax=Oceanirhabdus sp. W0125-5 TaxID=2999116 RepID=UPI0022F321D5|nr:SPOCS domain-containing protein [Oceanirhabdus sp. W0125-5]WBW96633.1 DUF3794 domain-containing protein [Oceanirhabdus sp. W0125-5]
MTRNLNSSIVQLCPSAPDRVAKYFTEIFISQTVKIPYQKPNMEDIIKIIPEITIDVCDTIEVELPNGEKGNKIFVVGNVYLKVQYVSTNLNQSVHFVRYQIPFQAIILQPCGDLIDPTDSIFPDNYVVHVCIEKITKKIIDNRTAHFEMLMLVWVEEVDTPIPTPTPAP